MLENLEDRRMLASGSTVTLVAGVLTVTGGTSADYISVSEDGGNVRVSYYDTAGNFHDGTAAGDNFSGVTAINIDGGKKDDTIFYSGNTIGAKVNGGASGADSITITDAGTGSSTVHGGNKADSILVLDGNNTQVFGDDDNDLIEITDGGGSDVDGGKGDDYIKVVIANQTNVVGGSGNDTILLNFDSINAPGSHAAAEAYVLAGKGNDIIYIYDGTGTIDGGAKTDTSYDLSGGTETFVIINVEKQY